MRENRIHVPFVKDFSLQEYLLFINDIKPVLRLRLSHGDNFKKFKYFFETHGFHILKKELNFKNFREPRKIIYISKSMDLARKAYELERSNKKKELGKILGYPECCNIFFSDVAIHAANRNVNKIPYITNIFLNTKGKPSFYTNNIFNSSGRANTYKKKLIMNRKLLEMGKYFLIPHIPCSYDCKESIKIGKETLKLLKDEKLIFAYEIVKNLKRIFLVFSDFEFVIFDGMVKGNEIVYSKAEAINCCDENKLKEGNKIIMKNEVIQIFKNDYLLHSIKKKNKYDGVIINFSQF